MGSHLIRIKCVSCLALRGEEEVLPQKMVRECIVQNVSAYEKKCGIRDIVDAPVGSSNIFSG